MKCPRCKDQEEMKRIIVENIEVDRCNKCFGIWFDGGEFKELKDKAEQGHSEQIAEIDVAYVKGQKFAPTKESINCPRCSIPMHEFNFMYSSGVFVDECEICEGIWFDGGEFKKILDYIKEVSAPMSAEEYARLAPLLERDRQLGLMASAQADDAIGSSSALGKTLKAVYRLLKIVS